MTSESALHGQNSDKGCGEIMLFGVRVKVDPMRKSVSMNDLSQYVHVQTVNNNSNSNTHDGSGYASADDGIRNKSNGGRERKRGVPWTEDEHKLFLLGLKKVGKGDWRGISRNFVKTRTPTQVASHAQKYFLRRSNLNRRRRRSSLFDITTDSVAAISMEEEQAPEGNKSQLMQDSPQISTPTVAAIPASVGPVPLTETSTRSAYSYVDHKQERDSLSLSLSLNLSLSCDHSNGTRHAISGFNNGDCVISVG